MLFFTLQINVFNIYDVIRLGYIIAFNSRLNLLIKQRILNITKICANAHETRESLQQFRFSSLAENSGVHAKLIYRYQILYLDHVTIVA